MVRLRSVVLAVFVAARVTAEETCSATNAFGGLCSSAGTVTMNDTECLASGFDTSRLKCTTCDMLEKRLTELSVGGQNVVGMCRGCCQEVASTKQYDSAWLIADAGQQERDQDLHDFIKRKAPLFKSLEVEYLEGAAPAIELENEDDPDSVLRAEVTGWKSHHLVDFLTARLKSAQGEEANVAAEGAWTAEIQSCSG